jgi:formate dehydrogenase iron-sulfur subunit
MPISRRDFLKTAGVGLGALVLPTSAASAQADVVKDPDSASMLYDATICVGCRACQTACKKRSELPSETDNRGLYEMPNDLSANTWTIIKSYDGPDGHSFVKNQCMHCLEPACVSVCPVAALQKTEEGPVVYHAERCIGCRYCMAACPFNVPKTQWDKVLPLIQKCDFCADRQAEGLAPACGEACPTGALIFGTRKQMLDIAHERVKDENRYDDHVYGEKEAGGTSMLYISKVDYRNLGFPEERKTALPTLTWPYMAAVPGVIAVMSTLSTAIYLRTHKEDKKAEKEDKDGR